MDVWNPEDTDDEFYEFLKETPKVSNAVIRVMKADKVWHHSIGIEQDL